MAGRLEARPGGEVRGQSETTGGQGEGGKPTNPSRAQTLQFSPQPKACHPRVELSDQFAQVSQVTRPWGRRWLWEGHNLYRDSTVAFTCLPVHQALPGRFFYHLEMKEGWTEVGES